MTNKLFPTWRKTATVFGSVSIAARALGLTVRCWEVRDSDGFDKVFAVMVRHERQCRGEEDPQTLVGCQMFQGHGHRHEQQQQADNLHKTPSIACVTRCRVMPNSG